MFKMQNSQVLMTLNKLDLMEVFIWCLYISDIYLPKFEHGLNTFCDIDYGDCGGSNLNQTKMLWIVHIFFL